MADVSLRVVLMLRLLCTTEAYSTGINWSTSGQARPRGIGKLHARRPLCCECSRLVYDPQHPPAPCHRVIVDEPIRSILNPVRWTCANKANYYPSPPRALLTRPRRPSIDVSYCYTHSVHGWQLANSVPLIAYQWTVEGCRPII